MYEARVAILPHFPGPETEAQRRVSPPKSHREERHSRPGVPGLSVPELLLLAVPHTIPRGLDLLLFPRGEN